MSPIGFSAQKYMYHNIILYYKKILTILYYMDNFFFIRRFKWGAPIVSFTRGLYRIVSIVAMRQLSHSTFHRHPIEHLGFP